MVRKNNLKLQKNQNCCKRVRKTAHKTIVCLENICAYIVSCGKLITYELHEQIRKIEFQALLKRISNRHDTAIRWQSSAILALQESTLFQ